MANDYTGNPIVLDTYSAVIDVCSELGFATGTKLKVAQIEWQTPTSTAHTALISTYASGRPVFSEQCTTANQSIIKYNLGWVDNLYIAINGWGSGKILIWLE